MVRPAVVRMAWAHRRSLVVIGLLASAVGAALTGFTSYQSAARDSLLRQQLAAAPASQLGFSVDKRVVAEVPRRQVREFFAAVQRIEAPARSFATPVIGEEMGQNILRPGLGATTIVWRDGECEHLHITEGRCPAAANEVLVHDATAGLLDWRLGTLLHLGGAPRQLKVVGIFASPGSDPFWTARDYFTPSGERESAATGTVTYDPIFVTRQAFAAIPQLQRFGAAVVTFGVRPDAITAGRISTLRQVESRLDRYALASGADVGAPLLSVLAGGTHSQQLLHTNSWIFLIQALVLLVILLFIAIDDLLEIRIADLLLLRLRGLRWTTVIRHTLGDVGLALAGCVPLGIVAGIAGARLVAGRELVAGIQPSGSAASLWQGCVALGVAYLVLGLAVGRRLLAGTAGAGSWLASRIAAVSRSWLLEVIALSAVAAVLIDLLSQQPPATTTSQAGSYLMLPIVLGLLGGLLVDRGLIRTARGLVAAGVAESRLGGYLALRHIGRFRRGARTTVIAVAGCAFVTFAVTQFLTVRANATRAGAVVVGAPAVLDVAIGDSDLDAAVRRLNAAGIVATPVSVTERGGLADVATLLVQPTSFAAVANLSQSGLTDPRRQLSALEPPTAPPVIVRGRRLDLVMKQTAGPAHVPISVQVTLTNPQQALQRHIAAGTLRPDARTRLHVPLAACYPFCRLTGIDVTPATSSNASESALARADTRVGVELFGAEEQGKAGRRPVRLPLSSPAAWFGLSGGVPDDSVATITSAAGRLSVELHGTLSNSLGFGPASYAVPMPAITAGDAAEQPAIPGYAGLALPIRSVARLPSLPELRTNGAIISAAQASEAGDGSLAQTSQQVWLRDPARIGAATAALGRAGIAVDTVRTADAEASVLRHQGPGLASSFLLSIALLLGLATVLAVILDLLAIGQRRAMELVELLQTGARRRTLSGYLIAEQLLLLAPGVVAGAALGAVAQRLVSPRLAQYARVLTAPSPSFPVHPVAAALVALAFLIVAVPCMVVVSRRSIDQAAERGRR